jgi:hypothetical protein
MGYPSAPALRDFIRPGPKEKAGNRLFRDPTQVDFIYPATIVLKEISL